MRYPSFCFPSLSVSSLASLARTWDYGGLDKIILEHRHPDSVAFMYDIQINNHERPLQEKKMQKREASITPPPGRMTI